MQKITPIIVSFFIAQLSYGQHEARAYADIQSYLRNDYITIANISIIERTKQDIKMVGGNDYKIVSEDKGISKDIKKHYWAIQCSGNFMLNMKMMESTWYAKALFRSTKHILFKAGKGKIKGTQHDASAAAFGGPVGGAISGAKQAMIRYDYLLDLETSQITVLTKKGGGLKDALASNKELQNKYISVGMPCDIDSYISYLNDLDSEIK